MELRIDYKGRQGILRELFTLNVDDRRLLPYVDLPQVLEIGETIDYSHMKFFIQGVRIVS